MMDPNTPRGTTDPREPDPQRRDVTTDGRHGGGRYGGSRGLAIGAAIVVALLVLWAIFGGGGEETAPETAPAAIEGTEAPAANDPAAPATNDPALPTTDETAPAAGGTEEGAPAD